MADRVVDQVDQHQLELRRIAEHHRIARDLAAHHDLLFVGQRLQHPAGLVDHRPQPDPFAQRRIAGAIRLAGERQEALDHPLYAIDLAQALLEVEPVLLGRPRPPQADVDAGPQRSDRGAQLVRGVGGEAPHAPHLGLHPVEQLVELFGERAISTTGLATARRPPRFCASTPWIAAISSSMVEVHGGEVRVVDDTEPGAKFEILLPAEVPAEVPAA